MKIIDYGLEKLSDSFEFFFPSMNWYCDGIKSGWLRLLLFPVFGLQMCLTLFPFLFLIIIIFGIPFMILAMIDMFVMIYKGEL